MSSNFGGELDARMDVDAEQTGRIRILVEYTVAPANRQIGVLVYTPRSSLAALFIRLVETYIVCTRDAEFISLCTQRIVRTSGEN